MKISMIDLYFQLPLGIFMVPKFLNSVLPPYYLTTHISLLNSNSLLFICQLPLIVSTAFCQSTFFSSMIPLASSKRITKSHGFFLCNILNIWYFSPLLSIPTASGLHHFFYFNKPFIEVRHTYRKMNKS